LKNKHLKKIVLIIFVCCNLNLVNSSCTIQKPSICVKNGKEYGKISGIFRGTYWNYYEAALSYTEGQCLNEAENYFNTAIKLRDLDKKYAMTYGMHYIHYFPHREKGIVHLFKGEFKSAIKELERSIHDEKSGRAVHYLNAARKAMTLQNRTDHSAPQISILTDNTNILINDYAILLSGSVTDDTYIEKITINDDPVRVEQFSPSIEFEKSVRLKPGNNILKIRAIDVVGNMTEDQQTVFVDIEGPILSFDIQNKTLHNKTIFMGTVFDRSGLKTLDITINGIKTLSKKLQNNKAYEINHIIEQTSEFTNLKIESEDTVGNKSIYVVQLTNKNYILPQLMSENRNIFLSEQFTLSYRNIEQIFNPLKKNYKPISQRILLASNTYMPIIASNETSKSIIELEGFNDQQTIYFDEVLIKVKVSSDDEIKKISILLNGKPLSTTASYSECKLKNCIFQTINAKFENENNKVTVIVNDDDNNKKEFNFNKKELDIDDTIMTVAMIPADTNSLINNKIQGVLLNSIVESERFNVVPLKTIDDIVKARQAQCLELVKCLENGESQAPLWMLKWSVESQEASRPVQISKNKSALEIGLSNVGSLKVDGNMVQKVIMQKIQYLEITVNVMDIEDNNRVITIETSLTIPIT